MEGMRYCMNCSDGFGIGRKCAAKRTPATALCVFRSQKYVGEFPSEKYKFPSANKRKGSDYTSTQSVSKTKAR